jgi:hypothetical protein
MFASALALTMMISSPAFAARSTFDRPLHSAPAALAGPQYSDPDLAIKNGAVIGRDTDPNVRFELRRDNPYY